MIKDRVPERLLLLSGPMGTGHVRAAEALQKWCKLKYPGVNVMNKSVAEYMSPLALFVYVTFYHFMLRHFAFLWQFIYRNVNKPPSAPTFLSHFFQRLGESAESAVLKLVEDFKPDVIICTHFLPASIFASARANGKKLPVIGIVITDFSIHWTYVHNELDLFFVATSNMALMLHLRGIDRHKIFVTGCPVQPAFAEDFSQARCAEIRASLGLEDKPYVIVMMGGESIGRMEAISRQILDHHPEVCVLAMAGKNQRQYKRLMTLSKNATYKDRLIPVPYTTRVSDYMAISFLLVSKPGGIFTSEAWAMNRALILIDPIPGHEEKNALYLSSMGVAAFANSLQELNYISMQPDATWISVVKQNQLQQSPAQAGFKIIAATFNETLDHLDTAE